MYDENNENNTTVFQFDKFMYYPNSDRLRRNSQTRINTAECTAQHFYLTSRGAHQAQRNRSDSIWSALGNNGASYVPCYIPRQYQSTNPTLQISDIKGQQGQRKDIRQQFTISRPDKDRSIELSNREDGRSKNKNVSFNLIDEDKIRVGDRGNQKVLKEQNKNVSQKQGYRLSSKSKQKMRGRQNDAQMLTASKSKQKKPLTKQQQQRRQIFLKECYSIDQYLKTHKAETRTMPNSAIKLFYERPCLQAYGRKNTSGNNGFIYNDFMKTHNVLPHRLGNQPTKYQAYRSALNFCKRTKIDPQERWKKIHRQMRKRLDMKLLVQYFAEGVIDVNQDNIQQALKLNINTVEGIYFQRSKSLGNLERLPASQRISNDNTMSTASKTNKLDFNSTRATNDLKDTGQSQRLSSLKRSKSWGKKQYLFLYKYKDKDGDVHYCKDRHGITCYVDPTFEENRDAYTKWLKKIKPIEAQDVSPSDRNLDQQLLNNHIISKQQQGQFAKHYMLPNCDQPQRYKPQKYSIKARKKSMIQSKEVKVSQ